MHLLRVTYPEAEQMFRRMVFNVLATNLDDYTKNFSFRLKKGERWQLSPAYDICFAYDPTNIWVSQQTLSINGKRNEITKEDFMTIAKANNIKKGEEIVDEINQVVRKWESFANEAKVDEKHIFHIQSNLHTIMR